MQVFIKTLSGKTVTITVQDEDTIASVKAKIQEKEKVPVAQQRIVYSGKDLEDDQTISGCGIKKEAILQLILKVSEKNQASYSFAQMTELSVAQTQANKYFNDAVGLQDELIEYRDEETKLDEYSNPAGEGFDLGKDGEFSEFTILMLRQACSMESPAIALQRKGFTVVEVADEKSFVDKLKFADIAWIISGGVGWGNTWHMNKDVFTKAIVEYHRSGGALFVWADNDPLFEHANAILPILLKSPVKLIGNTPGEHVLKLGTEGKDGYFVPHIISTGVVSLYEGVTICYPETLGPLKVLAMSSDGFPVSCYADNECLGDDTVGRIMVDCGYTKNYVSWEAAGTARYIVNACVWLLGIEHKMLHNIPIKGRNSDRVLKPTKFIPSRPTEPSTSPLLPSPPHSSSSSPPSSSPPSFFSRVFGNKK